MHEDVTVILTKMGWIRRIKTVGENLRFKEGDDLLALLPANTRDNIAIFSSTGKVYVVKANDLPAGSGFGEPVSESVQVRRRRTARDSNEFLIGLWRRSNGDGRKR